MRRPTNSLQQLVSSLAKQEKKVKIFKSKKHVKGKLILKELTKKGNIKLLIKDDKFEYKFIVIKRQKNNYSLAEKFQLNQYISLAGIPRFGMIICTKIKQPKALLDAYQTLLI